MTISLPQVFIWIIIAAVVGVVGELIARRRAPDGIIGAIILGFLAIFIVVGLFHFHIAGEPFLGGVPLISCPPLLFTLLSAWRLRTSSTAPPLVLVRLLNWAEEGSHGLPSCLNPSPM
jgi:uncharacterized membrane protein YeaQ/YmgE (transglycosylase-associated protein family)